MRKMIEACPSCDSSSLTITEVTCDACGTQVRSRYQPGPLSVLDEEQQTFLLLFVRSRGNLKELEKTLGVSYPTVRAKLDELIDRLEPPAAPQARRRPQSGAGHGAVGPTGRRRCAGIAAQQRDASFAIWRTYRR